MKKLTNTRLETDFSLLRDINSQRILGYLLIKWKVNGVHSSSFTGRRPKLWRKKYLNYRKRLLKKNVSLSKKSRRLNSCGLQGNQTRVMFYPRELWIYYLPSEAR